MKKVITVVIVLAVITGIWFAYSRYREEQQALAMSNLQTVRAERGDLTATVGATGTVRANQTTILAWQTSGTVEEVLADVGEKISAGQVLARLKQTSLPQTVIMATVDLVNAQKALDELLEPASGLALSQAEQAINRADKAVRDAERRVRNLQSTASQIDIDQAQANMVLAKTVMDRAWSEYEPYVNKPEDNLVRATLLSKYAQAKKDYENAARLYNNLRGTASEFDQNMAKSDLAVAEAQLQDAEEAYERLLAGAEADDIAAAEARIAAAQATIDMHRIAAPFEGVITDIQIKPGDQVSPGAVAFRVDDLAHLLVDVRVSEVDINRIRAGQEATLSFDAIPGKEYHGVVREVALVGSANQGVVDFIVTVELSDYDEAVKPGMTAAVNIVVNELQGVLLAPNRAVRLRDGQRVVYVLKNGVPEPVRIVLGASSDTVSEVQEGDLKVGDEIVLNPPVVFEQSGPPGFIGR